MTTCMTCTWIHHLTRGHICLLLLIQPLRHWGEGVGFSEPSKIPYVPFVISASCTEKAHCNDG